MPTQWLLLIALILISFYLLKSKPTAKTQAVRRLVLIAALLGGVILVIIPDLLFTTASLLGVKEGSDLLLYLFIVAMMFYIVHQYRRMISLDKTNTDLAREIALLRADMEDQHSTR